MAIDIQAMHTSIRVQSSNQDHHLWRNHGRWWCHFTVHYPDHTKQRVRRSTGTQRVEEARQIRDFLFAVLGGFREAAPGVPIETTIAEPTWRTSDTP